MPFRLLLAFSALAVTILMMSTERERAKRKKPFCVVVNSVWRAGRLCDGGNACCDGMWPTRGKLEAHIEYLNIKLNYTHTGTTGTKTRTRKQEAEPDQRMIGDGASSAVHRLTVHYFNWVAEWLFLFWTFWNKTNLSAWHPASLSINCSVRRRSYGSYWNINCSHPFSKCELTNSALIRFNDSMTGWVRSLTEFNKSVTISLIKVTCFASISIGLDGVALPIVWASTAGNDVRRPFCLTAWHRASSLSKWYSWYLGLHSVNSCCWRYSIVPMALPKLARRWYLFDDEVLFFFIFTRLCFICCYVRVLFK